jgi:hypothetical protein
MSQPVSQDKTRVLKPQAAKPVKGPNLVAWEVPAPLIAFVFLIAAAIIGFQIWKSLQPSVYQKPMTKEMARAMVRAHIGPNAPLPKELQ